MSGAWTRMVMDNEKQIDKKENPICQKTYAHRLKSSKLESMGQKGIFQGFRYIVLSCPAERTFLHL